MNGYDDSADLAGLDTRLRTPRRQPGMPSSMRLSDVYSPPMDLDMMGQNLASASSQMPAEGAGAGQGSMMGAFGGSKIGPNTAAAKAFRYRLPDMGYEEA